MPKKKRIILKETEMDDIIRHCDCCYVGMIDQNNKPYVLPFNFGYRDKCVYIHSGTSGKKIDIFKKNPRVCIAFSTAHQLHHQNENVACSFFMAYKSVLCYGIVEPVEEYDKKVEALNIIMQQYTGRDFKYSPPSINGILTFKVVVEEMTGKEFGNLS